MTEQTLIGLMVLFGVFVTAGGTILGVIVKQLSDRIGILEEKNTDLHRYNVSLWSWAREHVDLYYRYRRDDAPAPKPIPIPND